VVASATAGSLVSAVSVVPLSDSVANPTATPSTSIVGASDLISSGSSSSSWISYTLPRSVTGQLSPDATTFSSTGGAAAAGAATTGASTSDAVSAPTVSPASRRRDGRTDTGVFIARPFDRGAIPELDRSHLGGRAFRRRSATVTAM